MEILSACDHQTSLHRFAESKAPSDTNVLPPVDSALVHEKLELLCSLDATRQTTQRGPFFWTSGTVGLMAIGILKSKHRGSRAESCGLFIEYCISAYGTAHITVALSEGIWYVGECKDMCRMIRSD